MNILGRRLADERGRDDADLTLWRLFQLDNESGLLLILDYN